MQHQKVNFLTAIKLLKEHKGDCCARLQTNSGLVEVEINYAMALLEYVDGEFIGLYAPTIDEIFSEDWEVVNLVNKGKRA